MLVFVSSHSFYEQLLLATRETGWPGEVRTRRWRPSGQRDRAQQTAWAAQQPAHGEARRPGEERRRSWRAYCSQGEPERERWDGQGRACPWNEAGYGEAFSGVVSLCGKDVLIWFVEEVSFDVRGLLA